MNGSENEFNEGIESEFVDEDETDAGPGALKKIREKLQKAVEEKQEYLDGWQRARADFTNFKRDESARSVEQELRIKTELGEAVIPALDSFEMAMKDKSFSATDTNLKKGFEAVYAHLIKSLERVGIVRFDPTGEKFDPYKHEALQEIQTDETDKDHTVASIHRAGYAIGERIVRPAQVAVYTFTE